MRSVHPRPWLVALWALALVSALAACDRPPRPAIATGTPPGSDLPPVAVELTTALGAVVIDVYPEQAPISAAGFLALVDGGHYDGATFYRVVRPDNDPSAAPIEVVQGGLMGATFLAPDESSRTSEGFGERPGIGPLAHETTDRTGLLNEAGVIAWARSAPGSASTEFFINLIPNPVLDTGATERNPDAAGYATFGRVRSGMAVLRQIQAQPTITAVQDNQALAAQVLLQPVRVERAQRLPVQIPTP